MVFLFQVNSFYVQLGRHLCKYYFLEKYTDTAMKCYCLHIISIYCCTITPVYKALRTFACFKITYCNHNTKIQGNFLRAHISFFSVISILALAVKNIEQIHKKIGPNY